MQFKHILMTAAAVAVVACQKPAADEPLKPTEASYVGTVTVISGETPFDNEDIEVSFNPAEDGATASITIYQIRFVPKMPVTIDVTIPNVNVTAGTEVITLACDNVIPLAMGGGYPRRDRVHRHNQGRRAEFLAEFRQFPHQLQGHAEEKLIILISFAGGRRFTDLCVNLRPL